MATDINQTSLLAKSLELPKPGESTEALGISQGDILIRTGILAAIADMRANPNLLDYVFANLLRDELTFKEYGAAEGTRAKEWFLRTEIPVFLNVRLDEVKLPCVSIALGNSTEAENTLGDVHYVPNEVASGSTRLLAGPFTPVAYDPATGTVTMPASIGSTLLISTDMVVQDKAGRKYPILELLTLNSFKIQAGVVADLVGATIRTSNSGVGAQVESLAFRETYIIGCHANNEPVYLTYLHSIITFALLRYKQILFEGRGFERSTISSSDFSKNEAFGVENVYSRFITITGFVRNYWPKTFAPLDASTGSVAIVDGAIALPEDDGDPNDALWIGIEDVDSVGLLKP